MLCRRIDFGVSHMQLSPRAHQRGVSLLELMIGIAVGLLVIASSLVIYLNGSRGSAESIRANRFNQDLREVMSVMVNDIRRTGFSADTGAGVINAFASATTNIAINGSCILYAYDAIYEGGSAGTLDSIDVFGFRLNGTTLQMLNSAAALTSTDTAACANANAWVDLTDPTEILVQSLTFTTSGSRCLSFDPSVYNPDDTTTYTAWTVSSGGTLSACDAVAGSPISPTPAAYPPASNTFIETRQITIALTARHASEASYTRTLTETVLVRNNRIRN